MKKLLLSAAAFVALGITTMNAQTDKGNWMFGGSSTISFASSNSQLEYDGEDFGEETKSSTFSVSPEVNYFVMDNLAVGLSVAFSSSKDEIGDVEDKTNSMALMPQATYFFKNGDIAPFIGIDLGYMSLSHGDDDTLKYGGLAFGGHAGLAYFVNESVSLNFIVNYVNASLANKEDSKAKQKLSALGVGIGFSFYL